MDILSWTKLAPTIKVVDTKKKFYHNYLYKIVMYLPAARLILNKSSMPMDFQIAELTQLFEDKGHRYNWGYLARQRQMSRLSNANAEKLTYFKDTIEQYKNQAKARVEEPYLSLYSNDEDLLFQIAKKYDEDIREVHRPANAQAVEILDRGEIVVKNQTEYDYKVLFKESGQFDTDTRLQVYNFLTSQGDTVKMTKSCEKNLKHRNYWFTQTYFYTNNPDILTFLNIIAPGAITGIYKLTKLEP